MRFTKEQMLAHVDAIIDRQQQDLDELKITRNKNMRVRMDRIKDKLAELRSFRQDLDFGSDPDVRMLESIARDMRDLGW